MIASELIAVLRDTIETHGDLEIVGGYISEDGGISEVTVLDADGLEVDDCHSKGVSLFLQ